MPLGARPVIRGGKGAKLLIIGQAPGTRVHETGLPWNDRSGERLRDWLQLEPALFYDENLVAIVPMGFCYPGVSPKGGDNPPRSECAPLWHPRILPLLPKIELTLLVGAHAQRRYLGPRRKQTMTETVAYFRDYLPRFLPLPHPSWRTSGWQKKNPWFDTDLLPVLRSAVAALVKSERRS